MRASVPVLMLLTGCDTVLPHKGVDPIYPLTGAHESLPCEACHGPGRPHRLSTVCADCHPKPDHFEGQACNFCHTTVNWDVPDDTPPPHTGDTGTVPQTDPDHDGLAPDRLCWDCHEAGSTLVPPDSQRPAGHYVDAYGDRYLDSDCGPCHTLTSWTDPTWFYPEHLVRSPHGTYDRTTKVTDTSLWVVACKDCHPVDLEHYVCGDSCHLDLSARLHNNLVIPSPEADAACLGCHPTGDRLPP